MFVCVFGVSFFLFCAWFPPAHSYKQQKTKQKLDPFYLGHKKKLKDDLNSSSLFELSSTFSYNVYPKDNVNSTSSAGLLVVGAGAAAGFLLLAVVGMFMLRACRQKKDDWTDTARSALTNSVIEIGRMDESEVPVTAIAVAGEWVEEGPGAEVPIAA
jgi:hypothetical protein